MNSFKETQIFIKLIEDNTGLNHDDASKLYITNGYNYPRAISTYQKQKEEDRLMALYLIHLQVFEVVGCDMDFEIFKKTL